MESMERNVTNLDRDPERVEREFKTVKQKRLHLNCFAPTELFWVMVNFYYRYLAPMKLKETAVTITISDSLI